MVDRVTQHPKGVHITSGAAFLGQHILRGEVVQGRVGIQGPSAVPLLKGKGCLQGNEDAEYNCVQGFFKVGTGGYSFPPPPPWISFPPSLDFLLPPLKI